MASRLRALLPAARAEIGRASRGLYGGKGVGTGNNRSFSEIKTRRTWKPNAQWVTLWSDILGRPLRIRATTYVLRWIDKVGGLDNYLLQTPDAKLDSEFGSKMKRDLQKIVANRKKLGRPASWLDALPPNSVESVLDEVHQAERLKDERA